MNSKKINLFAAAVIFFTAFSLLFSQTYFRNKINIPDITGYKTLKCDFHMHTVFSDGDVWPTFRVNEAWRDGLDAIAITDHIEYRYRKNELPKDENKSYQLAKETADDLGITLIQAGEITRDMPPGHMNILFVKDVNTLVQNDWKDAVSEAKKQRAILFWNHPSWDSQQPDGIARWYDEHSSLLQNGIMFGIEVVNGLDYSPEVHQWCLDKKLTILGNSDTHEPIAFEYEAEKVKRRTLTLVFAKDNSPEAIKDALLNRRTCVYYGNNLVGEEKYLREIFNNSVSLNTNKITAVGRETRNIQVTNNSDVTYELKLISENINVKFPKEISLLPGKTILFSIRARKADLNISEKVKIEYEVKNLLTAPGKGLIVPLEFDLKIGPKK